MEHEKSTGEDQMSAFKPTLAVAADFSKIRYPVYASPKLDGIRCSIVDGKALSRTLKPIPNKHIYSQLSHARLNGLDGELIVGEPTSPTCYNESVSNVMAYDKTPAYTFYVFDHHACGGTFEARRDIMLDTLGAGVWSDFHQITLLAQNLMHNEDEMLEYEASSVAEGYEGIILRSPNAPYKFGRSTVNEGYLLKVKRFEDSEAEIIGFEEEMFNGNEAQTNELGRTKRSTAQAGLVGKDTLGAFLVRDIHTGVEFSIGTGLTALQRGTFWARQDEYLGQLIKYKYFPVGVKDKPRHPVFLGLRDRRDL
jgi:DNA ligase-1